MTRMLQELPRRESFLSFFPEMTVFDRFFNTFELPSLFGEEHIIEPDFDVAETEKDYVITGEIPGMDVKDIHITLTNGVLTVKGEKKEEKEEKEKNFHRIERHYGSFHRSFRVPDGIKTDALDARYKDGILTLTLPKAEVSKVKKIEVKEKKAEKKVKAKKA